MNGVIEGFYGPPWTAAERGELLAALQAAGLDTYVYAPKDDLRHRAAWRELYPEREAAELGALAAAARAAGIAFVYALAPGLDLRYGDAADARCLEAKAAQLQALGVTDFALLFDDLPERPLPAGTTWAAAHAAATNAFFRFLRAGRPAARLLFCPAPYCGRMAAAGLGGADYLDVIGRELAPEIDVCWTGPEIVSAAITPEHIATVAARLRRPPVIWDNLFANDYDVRRFFCGPYAGRPPELRAAVRGLLVNPNSEWPLNAGPLRTFGRFVNLPPGRPWNERAEFLAALAAWRPRFAELGGPADEALLRRFADCFYLPYGEGPDADGFFRRLERALAPAPLPADEVRAVLAETTALRDFCGRLAELKDRALFAALHRRVWELREELDLAARGLQARLERGPGAAAHSDFHRPGTFRGGPMPRLQRLLAARADGSFAPP